MRRRADPVSLRPDGIALLLVVGAGLTLAVRIATHEMWFDELQAWSIVRANSLPGVFRALRFEGHPPLWYLVLWPVAHVTRDPRALQVVQYLVAMSSVIVIVLWSPFQRWLQAALIFGYYFGFEYGALSRSYGLGALLLLCALAAATRPRPRRLLAGVFLALTALTSVMGILTAAGVAVGLAVHDLTRVRGWRAARHDVRRLLVPVTVGCALSLGSLLPLPGGRTSYYLTHGSVWRSAFYGLAHVWRGMVPIPGTRYWPWNTNILDPGILNRSPLTSVVYTHVTEAWLGAFLAVAVAVLLARRHAGLATWVAGCLAVAGFEALVGAFAMRHIGHFFLLFVAAIWIATALDERARPVAAAPVVAGSLVAVLAWAQLGGAFAMTVGLAQRPFSTSRAVADAIRDAGLQDHVLVGDGDVFTAAVGQWLDRPMWFVNARRFGRYPIFDLRRERGGGDRTNPRPVLTEARHAPRPAGQPYVLVLSYGIPGGVATGLVEVAAFDRDLSTLRSVHVYLFDPVRYDQARAEARRDDHTPAGVR